MREEAAFLLVLALLGPLPDLLADEAQSLVGSRVRVQTIGAKTFLVGVVTDSDKQSLVIQSGRAANETRLSRDNLLTLEASRGFRRHTLQGLIGGALAWVVIVGLYAALDTLDESGVSEPLFIGGLLATGTVVGSLIKTERWEKVPLQKVTLRLSPTWRGAQVQLVLAF